MKHCPVCNSKKYRSDKKVGGYCRNCGFRHLPRMTDNSTLTIPLRRQL